MRRLALAALISGCAHVEWTCPVPVVVRLEPTQTSVRCPADGHLVTIQHPPQETPHARDLQPR